METIGFYIFYGINWIITLLPLSILYIFSDILFLILYYCLSYRKKTVTENLRNSFPEKSLKELKQISRKFYKHLSDLFIETLKLTHMGNKELSIRMKITNPELLKHLSNSGRDVIFVHSHYNNWEWVGVCIPMFSECKTVSIYKPIQNRLFNKFINNLRSRNNAGLAPMDKVARIIAENRRDNIRTFYGFMADQTPAKTLIRYYTEFLNQETPVFLGIEKIAAKYDMSVVFLNVQKVKRGFYELKIELLFDKTEGLPEYAITETHVKKLEELIRAKPEHWVWTHRRWKYKKSA